MGTRTDATTGGAGTDADTLDGQDGPTIFKLQ